MQRKIFESFSHWSDIPCCWNPRLSKFQLRETSETLGLVLGEIVEIQDQREVSSCREKRFLPWSAFKETGNKRQLGTKCSQNYLQGDIVWIINFLFEFVHVYFEHEQELLFLMICTSSCPGLPSMGLCGSHSYRSNFLWHHGWVGGWVGPSLVQTRPANPKAQKRKYPESLPMEQLVVDCPLPLLAISGQRWVGFFSVHLLALCSAQFCFFTLSTCSAEFYPGPFIALPCRQ